ncbi:uncharacterized protein KY384_007438 [Bacidia gigantensis]|uniref:uncharacterized protein n=1 Tax=Bacidia gigantensis TaxID=2732470 RepID=UPI001D054A71|nr:uncharacterized protein KY384_007438 [Bacidia gigantensis]KAG8528520.1 hypothetical protein KY384_007438 [Bacidia gigantensis]
MSDYDQDAAGAALFAACKIEDTLKKSKEILCAAYNLKLSPSERLTIDDPLACRLHDESLPPTIHSPETYRSLRITRTEVMETLSDLLDLYINHKSSTLGSNYQIDKFLNIRITLNQEVPSEQTPAHPTLKGKPEKRPPSQPQTNGVNKKKKHKQSPISPTVNLQTSPKSRDERGHGGSGVGEKEKEKEKEKGKPGLKEGTVRFMLSPRRAAEEKEVVDGFFKTVEFEEIVEVPVERGRR